MIQISRWVADIVGLYLNPPEGAVVLLMDEKTQVQELDRTQPLLPMNFCKTEKRTHDYVRHDQSVRGIEHQDWRGDRPVLSAATRRGVPEILWTTWLFGIRTRRSR
jgi:hypothetical protein